MYTHIFVTCIYKLYDTLIILEYTSNKFKKFEMLNK